MINGMINVYKEQGYTSHDVVAKLRGIVGQKKIGHTGTLDPDATGVLPVCLGKATKLCDMLTDQDKTYEATLLLGKSTDTQDISGRVIAEHDTSHLTEADVRECIQTYIGDYNQIPPMYSALKVNGKKLYELAREGIEVERKSRRVQIFAIEIMEMDLPRVRMNVTCSKGTYIRTLCHDIGKQLKVDGCMEHLIRTRVGKFHVNDSLSLSQIEAYKANDKMAEIIVPIDKMFDDMSAVHLNEKGFFLVSNGNRFSVEDMIEKDFHAKDQECIRVYNEQDDFLAIYQYQSEEKQFKIEKMFYQKDNGSKI